MDLNDLNIAGPKIYNKPVEDKEPLFFFWERQRDLISPSYNIVIYSKKEIFDKLSLKWFKILIVYRKYFLTVH